LRSLLESPIFSSVEDVVSQISEKISEAKVVQIITPADIEGVLSLVQVESSFLDSKINYRRKIFPERKHVTNDDYELTNLEGLKIIIAPFDEAKSNIEIKDDVIYLSPVSVEFQIDNSNKKHIGVIDTVALSACIASTIAPQGNRVRKVRPLSIAGNWLRQGVEVNYDPVYSIFRDHLNEEGSIDVRPITETIEIADGMIPDLPTRMLKKLKGKWGEMSFDERTSALSELVLPLLRNTTISTMRLEELIWHRMLIPGCDIDIASQLKIANDGWPDEDNAARLHASTVSDKLISQGYF